jgi:hypothetical protein
MPSTSSMDGSRRAPAPSARPILRTTGLARSTFLVAPMLLGTISACDATPGYLRKDIQERRMENLGVTSVDPSGTASAAGTSLVRNPDLPHMKPRKIGADTLSPGFHRYVHRCGTCHSAPDPGLRTASMWKYVFPRMEQRMRDAGLIPLGPTDQLMIQEFLAKHARRP